MFWRVGSQGDMFKKLRNKIMLINLLAVTIVILVMFFVVYVITYNNINYSVNMDLKNASREIDLISVRAPFPEKDQTAGINSAKGNDMRIMPSLLPLDTFRQPTLAFSVILDKESKLVRVLSFFSMKIEFYESMIQNALNHKNLTGRFKANDLLWAYQITDMPQGKKISFIDVTSRFEVLTNMIYTFSFVSAAAVVIIFAISRIFAEKAIEPIKAAFDKQKRFIADASHELKTPISIINTNADVLLANEDETIKSQKKWLEYIKSEGQRMTKLINELLYLAKIDYVDTSVIFVEECLSYIVESSVMSMETVAYEKGLLIQSDIESDLYALCNSEHMKQTAIILLDNAIKYAAQSSVITVELKKHSGNILLTVTNEGVPVSSEETDKLFDRFYRSDESRNRESGGYGLGLSIAKTIVMQHKGKIWAECADGTISFFITVPMLRPHI